jgi:predicted DNA-binding antitoxin AbrB/MazE fold protein
MKVKIEIKTPEGQAEGTLKKLKPFLIGFNKVKSESYINNNNSIMYLECEGRPKEILKITKNCYTYTAFIDQIFKQKIMGKGIMDLADSKDDIKELEKMLKEGTKVKIIKEASAEELVEGNKSWWDNIKQKFKKVD